MERTAPPDLAAILNLREFEALARRLIEPAAFDYICGGAGDELSLARNETAFTGLTFRPRVLVDVSDVDPSSSFLGRPTRLPIGIAPMAFQHYAHPDAEPASARAASRAGALMCLSTMSSRSIEEVAVAADDAGGGPRWFQLYVHRDRSVSADLVARAQASGYHAIVVTVDLPIAGLRERDTRNSFGYPDVFGNFSRPRAADADQRPLAEVIGGFNDASLSWDDLGWLRDLSPLPLVVKGILTAEDAALAVEHGAAGIVVSNHGGRQLDRTPAAIEVLAEVVDAIGGRAEVYLDGGVRRAVDVLASMALGADGVFIGRPMSYALAASGEAGVARAFEIIDRELRIDMALLGVTRLDQVGRQHVRQRA
jgi:(S)-2-hydroxy-acid oxidase